MKVVRSEVTSVVHSLPWLIAQDEGLFTAEGLQAEFVYASQRGTWQKKGASGGGHWSGTSRS